MQYDFTMQDCGTVWLLMPQNAAAEQHLGEHLGDEAVRWGKGVAVEPRYVEALGCALLNDGFSIAPWSCVDGTCGVSG